MKKLNIFILGKGTIGSTLATRVREIGHSVVQISRTSYVNDAGVMSEYTYSGLMKFCDDTGFAKPDILFIAIPTLDTGETAAAYIQEAHEHKVHVITCEKGSLSYHADSLLTLPWRDTTLSYTASVGGGTMMLQYMNLRVPTSRLITFEAVINGTCNFIFNQVAHSGRTLGEACDEAARLGYAEPGARDPLSLINGELKDVRMKTCVLFNTALANKLYITPRDLGTLALNETTLDDLSRRSSTVRLVVQCSNIEQSKIAEYAGCQFVTSVDGWSIQGGFRDLQKDPELLRWLPGGVGNAIHITEGKLGSGGKYTLTGPGAGAEATTSVMLNDMHSVVSKYFS
ncbi:MAG: hypothetical protein RI911_3 [Candidatus Parcubacteria bacterium]|jgi:homoserine dehydrogenase